MAIKPLNTKLFVQKQDTQVTSESGIIYEENKGLATCEVQIVALGPLLKDWDLWTVVVKSSDLIEVEGGYIVESEKVLAVK